MEKRAIEVKKEAANSRLRAIAKVLHGLGYLVDKLGRFVSTLKILGLF